VNTAVDTQFLNIVHIIQRHGSAISVIVKVTRP